jgi:prophage maintenance system killer protein
MYDPPRPLGSEPPFEGVDAEFVKTLWRLTFDLGGAHGAKVVRDEGTIEWIVDGIHTGANDGDPAWTIAGRALHRIVREHPFVDCNHRTGWLVCRTLMQVGGYELALPSVDVVQFVKSIDAESLDEDAVREWVKQAFLRLR